MGLLYAHAAPRARDGRSAALTRPGRWCRVAWTDCSFFQYAFAILMVNELGERTFDENCPQQLAEDALASLFPNASWPRIAWTCRGADYLSQTDLWPVRYGGIRGHFALLFAYLAIAFVGTYAMLHWVTRAR